MKPANSGTLTTNGGSSSIKFALYQDSDPRQRGLYGKIDRIGLSGTSLTFGDSATHQRVAKLPPVPRRDDAQGVQRYGGRARSDDCALGVPHSRSCPGGPCL